MIHLKKVMAAAPKKHVAAELADLYTPWGEALDVENVLPEHPRPQFARERVVMLNGLWEYAIVGCANAAEAYELAPAPSSFDGEIVVPFSPEAPLSGVRRQLKPDELLWYRRHVAFPELGTGERLLIHFDAVDYACTLYCDGHKVGSHVGGYTPFSFDITDFIDAHEAELALCVYDPSEAGTQLRGKQRIDRGDIWYTAQGGIWQPVWLEVVPQAHVKSIRLDADLDERTLTVDARVEGDGDLEVTLLDELGEEVAHGRQEAVRDRASLELHLESVRAWTPEDPFLYDVRITFRDDGVSSYCAFRTVEVAADDQGVARFMLNHEPLQLRGVLDQGYWPDGLLTAPSDEALVFDIEQAKALGFCMMRKHIKIERERWYYHCDRLGMLVVQDMVSGGGAYDPWFTSRIPTLVRRSWTALGDTGDKAHERLAAGDSAYRDEWLETCRSSVELLSNHPCICAWTLFNEGWGQFDAWAATHMVRRLDPTRPIDATSGWYDQSCGDYFSVHNYFRDLEVYDDPRAATSDRPRAFFLSEFGGHSWHVDGHSSLAGEYGYGSFESLRAWGDSVIESLAHAQVLGEQGLSAYVYTQLSDVEEETNGLLSYDRKVNKLACALSERGEASE